MINDCRVGISNACTLPIQKARMSTCHIFTVPVTTKTASERARNIRMIWAVRIICLFGYLSAITPPARVNIRIGADAAVPASPRKKGEFVNSYTSHPWAAWCIQVPVSDIICPNQNSLKFLCLSAAKG
jgi:hypothetical protein